MAANGEVGHKAKWEEIAEAKRRTLLESIPREWIIPGNKLPPASQLNIAGFPKESGWFTERELVITSRTAGELVAKLANQTWTAEEVARAFCKSAAAAHQLTNCLSEVFFSEAIETAKALDDHLRKTGKVVGPLHGLPISLKDNFNLIGKDSTVGFVSWVNAPATYNSTLVDILRAAGAVHYVKTNVPTAMMIAESVNNVFGRTVNPLNRALTSGGSSGGESALIAFGGSPLGVGTDIGGSLRIPAACTGIYTLRPSFGRFPTLGSKSGLAGQEAVNSVNGPMARSLGDLELFAKVVVGAEPWLHDPKALPIPWRAVESKTKLKLGVVWNDGTVTPTPPVQRALRETVQKLKNAGHEVVDWDPVEHPEACAILGRMFVADGGKAVRNILEPVSEPFRPEMEAYEKATELGVYDMWQLQIQRTALLKRYLDQWNRCGIDALLGPTTPYASVENGKFKYVGYTGVFNILDYSTVSFPCGIMADKDLDAKSAYWETESGALNIVDRRIYEDYNAEAVHGMPVSLQLIARRLEEERVIDMTRTVLGAL